MTSDNLYKLWHAKISFNDLCDVLGITLKDKEEWWQMHKNDIKHGIKDESNSLDDDELRMTMEEHEYGTESQIWKVFDNGNDDDLELYLYRDDQGKRDSAYYLDKIYLWTNSFAHKNQLNPCNWQQAAKARIYAEAMCSALNEAHIKKSK